MAKLKCANILPLIPLLADDALSAAESDRLKKHLSVCPACRREFDLYRAMKRTTASLSAPQLSSDFHEKLMKTIGETKLSQETASAPKRARVLRPSFLRHAMGYAAAAAVVALSVVTLSQVSFLDMPKTTPSDNLVAQPQVTQSQVTEDVTAQPQVVQPRVAQSPAGEPIPSIDSQVTPSRVTPSRVTPSRVTPSQATPHQDAPSQESTAPAASCGIVAEEPQQTSATYRVFIKTAHLPEAQELLADCPQNEHGYRVENSVSPLLEALSALPGYRTECIENGTEQPLTADYILLIGE